MRNIFLAVIFLSAADLNAQHESVKMPPAPLTDISQPKERVGLHDDVNEFPKQILSWDIKHLSISGNENFTKIPEEVKNYKNLTTFSMSGSNRVSTFPRTFGELQNLKSISIYSSYIKVFPVQFLKLKNLEDLYMFIPYIEAYPDNLGNLTNLKKLSLIGREYKSVIINEKEVFLKPLTLPKSIKKLKKVEELHLGGNMLESIPEEIGEMDNLTVVSLGKNNLESLPTTFSRLKKLKNLSLGQNKFKIFPSALYGAQNLETIYYEENIVEAIPPGIEMMINLRYFFAGKTKFSAQALAELWNVKSLEALDLSDCQIEKIPPGIEKLTKLKRLSFWGNKLSSEDLEKLKRALPNAHITLVNPYKTL